MWPFTPVFKNTRFDPNKDSAYESRSQTVLVPEGSVSSGLGETPPPKPATRMGRAMVPIKRAGGRVRRATKKVTSKAYFPLVFAWVLLGILSVVIPAISRSVKMNRYYRNSQFTNNRYNNAAAAQQYNNYNMNAAYNGAGGAQGGQYYNGAGGAQGGQYRNYGYNGAGGAGGGQYMNGYYERGPSADEEYQQMYDRNGCKWWQFACTPSYAQYGYESQPSWFSGWGTSQAQAKNDAYMGYTSAALQFVYYWQLIMFVLLLVYGFRVITKNLPRGGLIGMLLIWANMNFLMMWLLADGSIYADDPRINFFAQFSVLMFMTDFWYALFGAIFAVVLGLFCQREVQVVEEDVLVKPVDDYQQYEEPKLDTTAPAVTPVVTPAPEVDESGDPPADRASSPSDDFVRVV